MSHWTKSNRQKPYTQIGIRRCKCVRCGKQARFQWNICADGNVYRTLCLDCDIELNALVLFWARDPNAVAKAEAYEVRQRLLAGVENDEHARS